MNRVYVILVLIISVTISFDSFSLQSPEYFMSVTQKIFERIDISLSTLNETHCFAQKNFLLKPDEWFVHPQNELRLKLYLHQDDLMQDLTDIEMIKALLPSKKNYDYVLVMGSFKDDVILRLDFLNTLLHSGYRFKTVVLLAGERPLLDLEKKDLPKNCTTEMHMMNYLYQQHLMVKGDQDILSTNTPMLYTNDGVLARPTTEDTLYSFAHLAPQSGSCLLISHNPYIIRQTKVAQRVLNQKSFPIEGVDPEFDPNTLDIIMLMDEFARRLYEECKTITETPIVL